MQVHALESDFSVERSLTSLPQNLNGAIFMAVNLGRKATCFVNNATFEQQYLQIDEHI